MQFNQPQAAATRESLLSSPVERLHDALGRVELRPELRAMLVADSDACGALLRAAHRHAVAAVDTADTAHRATLRERAACLWCTAERTAQEALDALEPFEVRR